MTKPRPKPKSAHGGRRPGAGAPKGNVNALKHGHTSPRFWAAAIMVATVPELRAMFRNFRAAEQYETRRQFYDTMALAYDAILRDPELGKSIKQMIQDRMIETMLQIRIRPDGAAKSLEQSNNQVAAEPARSPPRPIAASLPTHPKTPLTVRGRRARNRPDPET